MYLHLRPQRKEKTMADCSQLRALLDHDQQERNTLDNPDFCQDQCGDDINCIKACLRSLPQRKKVLDEAITRLKDEIFICGILLKTWKHNGNGYTGQLTISSLAGTITDTTFGFIGTVVLDADPAAPRTIEGSWDEPAQHLTFQLQLAGTTRHQFYTGFVSTNPNADRVLA